MSVHVCAHTAPVAEARRRANISFQPTSDLVGRHCCFAIIIAIIALAACSKGVSITTIVILIICTSALIGAVCAGAFGSNLGCRFGCIIICCGCIQFSNEKFDDVI